MYLPALRRLNPILKFRLVKTVDMNIKKAPYWRFLFVEKCYKTQQFLYLNSAKQ
ncbi:hypothetical protein ACOMICROBIO_LMKGKHOH_02883 [Vibrio sp. B1FIG11]|nr:hypothetical protein ACOMICROBIO_LMKGKHOH_02883 [Vibrio sp. B1FIG11]CAE6913767.1 hypothetical protein ACOMICROBIO_LMKGKHOH_02883 [Vibrio sp. B1FIG11]